MKDAIELKKVIVNGLAVAIIAGLVSGIINGLLLLAFNFNILLLVFFMAYFISLYMRRSFSFYSKIYSIIAIPILLFSFILSQYVFYFIVTKSFLIAILLFPYFFDFLWAYSGSTEVILNNIIGTIIFIYSIFYVYRYTR